MGLIALSPAALMSPAALAQAACQPYAPDPYLLENLDQLVRGLPGAPPLTPQQRKQLKDLAQEKSPDRLAALAKLEAFWRFTRPAPLPNPSSGPAPLTVEIVWPSYPVANPARIEFDADGDGKPEWIEDAYQVGAPRRYVYLQHGQYEFAVRVHDRGGQVHIYKNLIKVFAPADFDSELQARWNGLREALRKGEIASALECIHTHSRARYKEAFEAVAGTLAQKVDEILTDVRAVKHRGGEALYQGVRTEGGNPVSFEVRFGIDVDGVWRISAF